MFKAKQYIYAVFVWCICFCIILAYTLIEAKHIKTTTFKVVAKNDSSSFSIYGISHKNEVINVLDYFYATNYIVVGDTTQLQNIESNIISKWSNSNLLQFNANNFEVNDASLKNRKDIYYFSKNINTIKSKLPFANKFLNWNGDVNFFKRIILHPLLVLVTLLLLFNKRLQQYFANKKFIPAAVFTNAWLPILLIFVLLLLLVLIYYNKYYFNQDDNYAQFTPVLLQGLNDWYINGNIPTYNPYQYCGVPTTALSTYAFFYPITHLSYLIAVYVVNDPLSFCNVFVIIHFMGGAFFMLKIMQHYKVHIAYALAASFGFIFCGFNVEVARAWYFIMPSVLFVPFLYWVVLKASLIKSISFKKHLLIGILLAMYAYAGNMQYWVYTVILLSIFWLYIAPFPFFKKLKTIVPSLCIAVVLFLPQVITSVYALRHLQRDALSGEGILNGFGSLIIPFLLNEKKSHFWGTDELKESSKYFYHGPSIFIAITIIFLLVFVISRFNKNFFKNTAPHIKVLLILFATVLLFSFGRFGGLWVITAKLPVFNNFRMPFKFLFFVQFFGVIAGALLLQQLQLKLKGILAFVSIAITLTTTLLIKDAFYVYANNKNNYTQYKFLQKIKTDNNYRIMSFGPLRSFHKDYSKSLTNNLPTQYGIASVQGYEPLFNYPVDVYKNYNEFSAKYFVVAKLPFTRHYYWGDAPLANNFINKPNIQLMYSDSTVNIYQNNNAQPIVTVLQNDSIVQNANPIITNHNNGVNITFANPIKATKIFLAYNYLPGIKVYVNGKRYKAINDTFNRIVIFPNQPVQNIRTLYKPFPFYKIG